MGHTELFCQQWQWNLLGDGISEVTLEQKKQCQDVKINRTFNVYTTRCILEFSIPLEGYLLLVGNAQ